MIVATILLSPVRTSGISTVHLWRGEGEPHRYRIADVRMMILFAKPSVFGNNGFCICADENKLCSLMAAFHVVQMMRMGPFILGEAFQWRQLKF